jgi:hypothetical protein
MSTFVGIVIATPSIQFEAMKLVVANMAANDASCEQLAVSWLALAQRGNRDIDDVPANACPLVRHAGADQCQMLERVEHNPLASHTVPARSKSPVTTTAWAHLRSSRWPSSAADSDGGSNEMSSTSINFCAGTTRRVRRSTRSGSVAAPSPSACLSSWSGGKGSSRYSGEDDLDAKAIAAYREFRKARYGTKAGALFRPLRDVWVAIKNRVLGRDRYNSANNIKVPSIRFLGLWDTVAAYGLPVDEWTIGIDRYIWPLELPDRKLWSGVQRACHALSLEDERTTFHPVLWDENGVSENKIRQVWFTGVHSNVGGGYPDDSLAGVPMLWIMKEAEAAGLHFKISPQQPDALLVATSSRDKDGRLYDSRSGLASYYRYGPRDVEALCNDDYNGVKILLPKIHEAVFTRMASSASAYAPIGLPKSYVVAKEDGTIVTQAAPTFETGAEAAKRHELQQLAWNMVWWRRVVYFLTVAASVHLLAFPLFYGVDPSGEYTTPLRFVSEAVRIAGEFLPGFVTTWWLDSFATNPFTFLASVVLVALLIGLGLRLKTIIEDRMLDAWRRRDPPRTAVTAVLDSVQRLRTAAWYRAFSPALRPAAWPQGVTPGVTRVAAHLPNFAQMADLLAVPRGLSRFNQIKDLAGPTLANCPMKYHKILAQCPTEMSADFSALNSLADVA